MALAVMVAVLVPACGGDDGGTDVAGTYAHPEEGTIVLDEDGSGTITQSGEPVEFTWERDGDTVAFSFGGAGEAEATVTDGDLVFRSGDFSGDEAETFTKE